MEEGRRNHLMLVLEHLQEVHHAWSEDNDVRYLTQEFQDILDETVEVFASGDIPADCRKISQAVGELAGLWAKWKETGASAGEDYPTNNAFWAALEHVEDCRQKVVKRSPVVLETLVELTRQKVSNRQICEIYGWVDSRGAPELWRLAEEREKPGTHLGPGFVPPIERQAAEEEERKRQALERIRGKRRQKMEDAPKKAPESLRQLAEEGVSVKQIADLKGMTVEAVMEECERLGVSVRQDYSDVATARAPQEPELPEEVKRSLGEPPKTLDQQIVELHQQGYAAPQIAKELTRDGVEVSHQKASAVIRRYNKNPELFGG